ncbi:unnamed protein product [Parnassius apollo]|uniref:(apollo) hypothetical protein n=1 Tax=Parnassius apollo TaxID=110799 RepID=A0A8S3YCF2_PARAO|nr:unnamed protein product [Parnassius apollo]
MVIFQGHKLDFKEGHRQIAVPANVTSPPAHPVSPVPGPSNSRTIQGGNYYKINFVKKGRRYLPALLHLVIAVSDSEDCDKHHLTEPPASL